MLSILTQFVLRLALGLTVALAATPHRLVDSGFFRVHLWVLLGLYTLTSLSTFTLSTQTEGAVPRAAFALSVAAAVVSYLGSVVWLYERKRWGQGMLLLLVGVGFAATCAATPMQGRAAGWMVLDAATGGALLGIVFSSMLLGHWYLNTPSMQLDPLRRLLCCMFLAVALRTMVAGAGLALEVRHAGWPEGSTLLFLGLRWTAGLAGVAGTGWLAWETLKIPNTQSATGILYVSLILAFLGELVAQMLSAGTTYPL